MRLHLERTPGGPPAVDSISKPVTILIVEDVPSVRKMICLMLKQRGYRALEAADGSQALTKLETEPVDLVLTDVTMPLMSGPELAARISQLRPEVRILFMSGYSDQPAVSSEGACSTMFIAKPFTGAALEEKIRDALGRPWAGFDRGERGIEPQ
jgi:CheY-like chemotaxis protein